MTRKPEALKVAKRLIRLLDMAQKRNPQTAEWVLSCVDLKITVAELRELAAYALTEKK